MAHELTDWYEEAERLRVERDALTARLVERDAQIAALEAVQDEAEAELVRFTDALMNIKRRIADAFAGDNLHSEARVLVGYIKDVLALGADSQAALRAARGEASDAQ